MGVLKGIAEFLYDFIIGDDWKIAAMVALVAAFGAAMVIAGASRAEWLAPTLGVLILAGFSTTMAIDVRRK